MLKSIKHRFLYGTAGLALSLAPALTPSAQAQGIPVFDSSSYFQALMTVQHTAAMIQQGTQIISQSAQTLNSLAKLTNPNSLVPALTNPNMVNLLPPEVSDMSKLFSGTVADIGALGNLATQIKQRYGLPQSYPQTVQYQAASTALDGANATAATQMAFGSNTLAIANQRTAGLTQLQSQIGTSPDAKTTLDLQAAILAVNAQTTNDLMKVQAIAVSKQANDEMRANQRAMTNPQSNLQTYNALMGNGK